MAERETVPGRDDEWHEETDVVVVGFGFAGGAAAISAHDAGAEVVLVEKMSPDQQAALKQLQSYERKVAVKMFELQEEIFDPVEASIQREMYPRKVN